MNQTPIKCSHCGNQTIFAEDPYKTPGATKYWRSTYENVGNAIFVVQRQTPSQNKKGKMTVRSTNEYITAVFCTPDCGVEYGNREKVSSGNE